MTQEQEVKGTTGENLDIFPEEIFFIHNIAGSNFAVKEDPNAGWDGFYVEADGIEAAVMTIYSLDGIQYLAKVKKYSLVPDKKINSDGVIRCTVDDNDYVSKKASASALKKLQALNVDQLRAKTLFGINKIDTDADSDKKSMKELYMMAGNGQVEGFKLETVGEFVAKIGGPMQLVDFIKGTRKARKPWKVMEKLEATKIGKS